jgi:ABC-type lipoprotein export system ATPase subunit
MFGSSRGRIRVSKTSSMLLHTLHDEGQTIIMVTHESEYASRCDRVITMEDGCLIGDCIR